MPRSLTILAAFLGLSLLLGGCGEDHGLIEGRYLLADDCGDENPHRFEPFQLSFGVFGFERGEGPLYIRAQRGGHSGADLFVLLVEDEDALREALAEAEEVRLDFGGAGAATPGEGAPVRASLVLAGRCPDNNQPLEARGGSIVFERLGRSPGDTVRLRLEDFDIVDTRRNETVGEDFQGEMDFVIRGDLPRQRFSW